MSLENKLVDNLEVDHKDQNQLNNMAINLRMATSQENKRNVRKRKGTLSSQYIGVHWDKSRNKWHARITHNSKNIHIGRFNSEVEAAKAYDESLSCIPIDESFKRYNFPE